MALIRQRQIGVKVEAVEGVAETIAGFDVSRELSAATHTDGVGLYSDRGRYKASLSESQSLVGAMLCTHKWTEEVSGGGKDISTSPAPFWATLRGCGFKAPVQLKKIVIGSATNGPFKIGDSVGDNATAGSATKKGTVWWVGTVGANSVVIYEPTLGTFADTDTLYAYRSPQPSAPVDSTPQEAGALFRLTSEGQATAPESCTVEDRINGEIHRIVGARGKMTLAFEHNKPSMIEAEFRGPKIIDSNNRPPDGALITSGVVVPPKPIMLGELGMPFTLDTYSPIMEKCRVVIDNTLTDRPNVSTGGVLAQNGEAIGYMPTRITGRKVTVELDPEAVAHATFDYLGKWKGEAPFVFLAQVGQATDALSGVLVVRAPSAAFDNDSWEYGDRNGIVVHNATAKCTGTNDDELAIAHVFPS